MSRWTHASCDECFTELSGKRVREAHRATGDDAFKEKCCKCGNNTNGLYVRYDPEKLSCGGRA